MKVSITKGSKEYCYYLSGIVLVILGWQILSLHYHHVIVPSPRKTLEALAFLYKSGELKENLLISFQRQVYGLFFGVFTGLASGLLAGYFRKLELIMQPLINLLLSVPAIVLAVMAMVWFGLGTKMTVFFVALLIFPVMHINTVEGFKSVDPTLLQMVQVYRLPLPLKISKVYLPGMSRGLIAGFSLALGSSVRLTIMGEVLGAREGVGQRISIARAYLETDYLFAWVIVLLVILISTEFLFIRPLKNLTERWS